MKTSAKNLFHIRFWGVRGSYPTPGKRTVSYGGNTACVEIQVAGHTIVLDAGTGIIPLGRFLLANSQERKNPLVVTLLFSHMHHDHTQGFPFFAPAFMPSARLNIMGPALLERDLEQILASNMLPPVFPITLQDMRASRRIYNLTEGEIVRLSDDQIDAQVYEIRDTQMPPSNDCVSIRILRSYAHPGGVLIYRIDWQGLSVVYATDTEGYANTDRRLVEFARDADLLIHDAQYTEAHYLGLVPGVRSTQGWGHSTIEMACAVAKAAGVKQLVLFHYEPGYTDQALDQIEKNSQKIFPQAIAAREGLELDLAGEALQQLAFQGLEQTGKVSVAGYEVAR